MAVNNMMKKRRKRRHQTLYTVGELNKIVDSVIHPFFGQNRSSIVLDALAHALVERDFKLSTSKFVRYNFPKIMKLLAKNTTTRKRSKK